MSNPTIEAIFGLGAMGKVYTNTKAKPLTVACPSLLYGVELEIENAIEHPNWRTPGMTAKEDGSLRNNGIEFVTEPMTLSVLAHVLESFFTKAKLTDDNYSERCSVHVHANCRDMTAEQVATVALLYQVFEHLFYKFVGNERHKNIFCVPWYETTLTYNVVSELNIASMTKIKSWLKYTGMNLLPLLGYGTVEFRHMAGTHDKDKILTWCNLIGCLFQYAKTHTLEEVKNRFVELNTTSAYRNTLDEIFGQWADYLRTVGPEYELLLEEGVLGMKYSILNPNETMSASKDRRYSIDDFMRADAPILDRRERAPRLRVDPRMAFDVAPGAAQPAIEPPRRNAPEEWIVRQI